MKDLPLDGGISSSTSRATAKESTIPFEDVRLHGIYSLVFMSKAAENFKNLRILKVNGVVFPMEEFARGFI